MKGSECYESNHDNPFSGIFQTNRKLEYFSNVCRPFIDSSNLFCGFMQMVIYEAARALVNLKNLKSRDLCPAISGSIIEEPTLCGFQFLPNFQCSCFKKRYHIVLDFIVESQQCFCIAYFAKIELKSDKKIPGQCCKVHFQSFCKVWASFEQK